MAEFGFLMKLIKMYKHIALMTAGSGFWAFILFPMPPEPLSAYEGKNLPDHAVILSVNWPHGNQKCREQRRGV